MASGLLGESLSGNHVERSWGAGPTEKDRSLPGTAPQLHRGSPSVGPRPELVIITCVFVNSARPPSWIRSVLTCLLCLSARQAVGKLLNEFSLFTLGPSNHTLSWVEEGGGNPPLPHSHTRLVYILSLLHRCPQREACGITMLCTAGGRVSGPQPNGVSAAMLESNYSCRLGDSGLLDRVPRLSDLMRDNSGLVVVQKRGHA